MIDRHGHSRRVPHMSSVSSLTGNNILATSFLRQKLAAEKSAFEQEVAEKNAAADPAGKTSAVDAFLSYAKKSTSEKLFDSILREMGLTREQLDKMDPKKREAVLKEVAERMKARLKDTAEKKAALVDMLA